MKRIKEEIINSALMTLQEDIASGQLDGGYIWQYITDNSNLIELAKTPEQDSMITIALSAFFAGIKWNMENMLFDDDAFVDDE